MPASALTRQFALIAKAQRLVQDGRIRRVARPKVFEVDGEVGTYCVTIYAGAPNGGYCTCRSGRADQPCSHLLGALHEAKPKRRQR